MWEVLFPSWEQSTLLVSSNMDHWEVLCDGNGVSHYGPSSTGISLVYLIEKRVEIIFIGHRIFSLLKTFLSLLFHKRDAQIYSSSEQDCLEKVMRVF